MYETLVSLLMASGIPFQEYAWDQRPDSDYGVIALEGAGDTLAGNQHIQNQAIEGSIDLYTHSNDREKAATIQAILNSLDGCAWYLNSIQYEGDTRLIHWEWVFQLEAM